MLLSFSEEVAFTLRDKGLRGRTVTLKVRYADFRTITRTRTLEFATNLGPRIFATAKQLLDKVDRGPLRLLGVQVSRLEDVRQPAQGSLFDAAEAQDSGEGSREAWMASSEKLSAATESMDELRRRYGRRTVVPASLLRQLREGDDGRAEPKPETLEAAD